MSVTDRTTPRLKARRFVLVLSTLIVVAIAPGSAQAPVKNADGTTTTSSKDETVVKGGTKETTRDADGHVTKEEFKDPKGKTVRVKYTTYPPGGQKRVDQIDYNPDGTPKSTTMTLTDLNGNSTEEHFVYKDSMVSGGEREEKDNKGDTKYFKFNKTTGGWDQYHPEKWGGEWYGSWLDFALEDIDPPFNRPNETGFDDNLISDPFAGDQACCEPKTQALAMVIQTAIVVSPGEPARPPLLGWAGSLFRSPGGANGVRLDVASATTARSWNDLEQTSRPAPAPRAGATRPLIAVISSLGTSQGEAFQLQMVNNTARAVELSGVIVVEPLKRSARDSVQKALQAMTPKLKAATVARVEGYCLNFALLPPEAGMMFRIAPPEVQRQFAPAARALKAIARLDAKGALTPDTNRKAYFESIKQYAVWTRIEHWDMKQFADAWVEMTHKQVVAQKRPWTSEMDSMLRSAAPKRWRDIQAILAEAESPQPR